MEEAQKVSVLLYGYADGLSEMADKGTLRSGDPNDKQSADVARAIRASLASPLARVADLMAVASLHG